MDGRIPHKHPPHYEIPVPDPVEFELQSFFDKFACGGQTAQDRLHHLRRSELTLLEEIAGREKRRQSYPPKLLHIYEEKQTESKRQLEKCKADQLKLIHGTNFTRRKLEAPLQRSCQELCREVLSNLPIEIVSMICEILVEPGIVSIYGHVFLDMYSNRCSTLNSAEVGAVNPPHWVPVSSNRRTHVWELEYVGPEMLQELIKTWYRTCRFTADMADGIVKFVELIDPWRMNLREIITQFNLSIHETSFVKGDWHSYHGDFSPRVKIQDDVNKLHPLRKGTKISISIHSKPGGRYTKNGWEKFERDLAVLLPAVQSLREAGHSVEQYLDEHLIKPNCSEADLLSWMREKGSHVLSAR